MDPVSYPALGNLTLAEQREYWTRSLKQCDALALESWINITAEPDNSEERRKYERLVRAQRRLRKAHELWLSTLPEEDEEALSPAQANPEPFPEDEGDDKDLDMALFRAPRYPVE